MPMERDANQSQRAPPSRPGVSGETLHEAVLETLASAVISLEPGGVVTTFNAAAEEITGLAPDVVVGRTFAEVFLSLGGAEAFTQAVLDAIYEGSSVRQRVVAAEFPAGKRSLAVSASRVRGVGGEDAGVAVVFDDISELRELRDKELALAQALESQHRELRQAYLKLEEQNEDLKVAERQARRAQLGGAAALVVLLLILGVSVVDLQPDASAPVAGVAPASDGEFVVVVEPRPLARLVNITGQLGPRREVDVVSPMNGKIASVEVPYGARVSQGQQLLSLDVGQLNIEHRDAEAAHIKALERFRETENWQASVEVSRARREVSKSRITLEDARSRLEETTFLLERGVIPASEHQSALRDLENRRLDLEASEQDLEIVLEKGAADGRVAKLELDNARARLDDLSETLSLAVLNAPVAGVVMRPPAQGAGGPGGEAVSRLAAGDTVSQGQRLLIIGDLKGLSVVGRVDEVNVVHIQPGNKASIKGDAFPDVVLPAVVTQVSSQAMNDQGGGAVPLFEIKVSVDDVSDSDLALLRIGMSAVIEIVAFEKSDALMVPIEAVSLVDGQASVMRLEDGQPRRVPVTFGETTVDGIEIVSGLAAGDELIVPAS